MITILIHTHNRPKKLKYIMTKYAIKFPSLDFIIINHGAAQKTEYIINGFKKNFTIYYLKEKNTHFPEQTIIHRPIKL